MQLGKVILDVLNDKKALQPDVLLKLQGELPPKADDPLTYGHGLILFYKDLGDVLQENGFITEGDLMGSLELAKESGGLKIAGINPIVLGAAYLNALATGGTITLPEAQSILDSAKVLSK